jgi:hypothetical protein
MKVKNWKSNSILILSLIVPLSWVNAQGQVLSQIAVPAPPPVKRRPGPALAVQSFRCSQKNGNQFSYFNPEDWNTYRTNDVYVHTIKQSGRDIGYAVTSGANLKSDILSSYSLHVRTYMAKYGTGIMEEIPEPVVPQQQGQPESLQVQQILDSGGQPQQKAPPKPKRMRPVLPRIFPAIENFFVSKVDQWGHDVTALSIIAEKESMVRVVCVKARHAFVSGGSTLSADGAAYGNGKRKGKSGSMTEKSDYEYCRSRDMEGTLKIDDFTQGLRTYQVVCSENGPISSYPEDAFVTLELNNVLNER